MTLKATVFSASALIFMAQASQADVTAQDIWNDWRTYWTGFGYTVTGDETMSGNTLSVSGVDLMIPIDDDGQSAKLTFSAIDFVENADGTVSMSFPDNIPLTFMMAPPGEPKIEGALSLSTDNFQMTASGAPSEITYDYSADAIGVALTDLTVGGDTLGPDMLTLAMTASDLAGTSLMTAGALRGVEQSMTLGKLDYTIAFQDPESDEMFSLQNSVASLGFEGITQVPPMTDMQDMGKALKDGFAVDGIFTYTGGASEFASTLDGSDTSGTSSSGSGQVSVKMDKQALTYSGSVLQIALDMVSSDLPLPVSGEFGEIGFIMMIPVAQNEAPSDFAFGLALRDFATSDMIWSLLDPAQVLPRDPATIAINLTGKVKVLFDIFDPEAGAAFQGDQPAELHALTLGDLLISAAGATLTGTGAATFDNTDLESFGGIPKPTGGIELELTGGNVLMENLVQMGLLPQEQVMGARMMMGLFTRPGATPDSITTKVEINEAGHILANGQRIQ
jgi:hypothetical protein